MSILVSLVGTNKYQEDKNRLVINIDFEPEDTYFNLPKKEYKSLKREQVLERLTAQLKEFTKTDKFLHSFLAKANVITTEWNGETFGQNEIPFLKSGLQHRLFTTAD
jgi:hypothetical protein